MRPTCGIASALVVCLPASRCYLRRSRHTPMTFPPCDRCVSRAHVRSISWWAGSCPELCLAPLRLGEGTNDSASGILLTMKSILSRHLYATFDVYTWTLVTSSYRTYYISNFFESSTVGMSGFLSYYFSSRSSCVSTYFRTSPIPPWTICFALAAFFYPYLEVQRKAASSENFRLLSLRIVWWTQPPDEKTMS